MAYELRPSQGSLFINRNPKNDKAPTLKGRALVEVGDQLIELEIAAWERHSDKAGDWLSLKVEAKGVRPLNSAVEQRFDSTPPRDSGRFGYKN